MADYVALHVKYFETYSLHQRNYTFRSLHQTGPLWRLEFLNITATKRTLCHSQSSPTQATISSFFKSVEAQRLLTPNVLRCKSKLLYLHFVPFKTDY